MSVSLTPLKKEKRDNSAVDLSNGHWAALVAMARAFDIDVSWNGCHDGQRHTPVQLIAMAERVEQIKDDAEWLRWLASNGGAKLS